ncbi:MAG: hypothetical protein SVU32_05275 [Candidatus Nanohaloarchaea archaeon]|nr:hypothetical protein [Candidatus Nanohaloarchaea archaeon]
MLIRGLVYGEDREDAAAKGKRDVFEPLVRGGVFDYYRTADLDGNGVSGTDRWGEYPMAEPADTEAGRALIEEGWEATVSQYEQAFERIDDFLDGHEYSDLWEDEDAHYEFHHAFNRVGEYEGPNTFLYDQHGSGVRHRGHLDQLYREAPNVEDYGSDDAGVREQDLYAVPADVHY